MALQKQKVSFPIASGQEDKVDPLQLPPDRLLSLQNAVFKKDGRVDKRFGYNSFSQTVLGQTSDINTGYGLANFKNQLNMFNGTRMYSYLDALDTWTERGLVTSIETNYRSVIRNDETQSNPAVDSSNGITCYAWEDTRGGVRYSVFDEEKGATIVADAVVDSSGVRPHVWAMGRYLVIFYGISGNIRYKRISVTEPSLLEAAVTIASDYDADDMFETERIGERIFIFYRNSATVNSVSCFWINNNFTASSKISHTGGTGSGSPRIRAGTIVGDSQNRVWMHFNQLHTDSSFQIWQWVYDYELETELQAPVDLYPGIGNVTTYPAERINALTTYINSNEQAVVYMQYSEPGVDESRIMRGIYSLDGTEIDFESKYFFNYWLQSKVFNDQDTNYIWFLYKKDSTVQPTYFLYDVDQNLISKVLSGNGGDVINPDSTFPNHSLTRPKLKSDNKWLFPVQKKGRLLTDEDNLLFSTLGIESVELDFASEKVFLNQEAANNLHIVGGMIQMYDGVSLVEHGFNLYPEIIPAAISTSGSSGISAGTRSYVAVFKWTDNQGQIHRSAPSIPVSYTNATAVTRIFVGAYSLGATKKTGAKMELYRTEDAGTVYYKVGETDVDSSVSVNDVEDLIPDADLLDNEILYTTGGVLENIAPTTCSLITHHKNRIFLGGLENKQQIQYSKTIRSGIPVEFNDFLVIDMPENGGIVTGLASLDDKLVVFKRGAIYVITGDGPNNLGQQNNFSDPQIVASDVGCVDSNSIVLMPDGLMFKSAKGIYLLSRGLQVQYAGASVENYNQYTITSSTLLDQSNEIRFTTNSEFTLVYNYLFKRWSVFNRYEGRDSLVHEQKFTYLSSDGSVKQETESYTDDNRQVRMQLVTPWYSMDDIQGFQRAYKVMLLGTYKGAHKLRVRVAYDFNPAFIHETKIQTDEVVDRSTYGSSTPYGDEAFYGGSWTPYQFNIDLKRQKCTSFRLYIEDEQSEDFNEGFTLSNIGIIYGRKGTENKGYGNNSSGTS